MLAALGGAAGLAVAWITAQFMRGRSAQRRRMDRHLADRRPRARAVTAAIALGVGIVTGLVPALRASRPDLTRRSRAECVKAACTATRLALGADRRAGSAVDRAARRRGPLRPEPVEPPLARPRHAAGRACWSVSPRWPAIAAGDSAARATERARRARVFADALAQVRSSRASTTASLTIGLPFRSGLSAVPSRARLGQHPALRRWLAEHLRGDQRLLRERGHAAAERARVHAGRSGGERARGDRQRHHGAHALAEGRRHRPVPVHRSRGRTADHLRAQSWASSPTCTGSACGSSASMHYYVPFGQERGMGGTYLVVRPHGDPASAIPELRTMLQRMDATIAYRRRFHAADRHRPADPVRGARRERVRHDGHPRTRSSPRWGSTA